MGTLLLTEGGRIERGVRLVGETPCCMTCRHFAYPNICCLNRRDIPQVMLGTIGECPMWERKPDDGDVGPR